MATIITKNSSTASAVPTAVQLQPGELAVNLADKRLHTKDSGGTVFELGTNPSTLALPNGTANGVAYLNGSKVLTTGSALTFDGTNFATTGTATATKLIPTGNVTAGNGMYLPTTNTLAWSNNGSETMRLDSSGNLGLGVTTSAWNAAFKAIEIGRLGDAVFSGSGGGPIVSANAYYGAGSWFYARTGAPATNYDIGGGTHKWYVAPSGTAGNTISFTQAMTLDSSGNLLVGTTVAAGKLTVSNSSTDGLAISTSGAYWAASTSHNNAGTQYFYEFKYGSTRIGSIQGNNTTTSYNTSSDYRLKENIQPMTGALAKVAALKPCTYKWKADGSDGEGFIAHELAEVVPQCVTGEKDAVDKDGKPVYQGIDTSFLVATLTAAIQELKAELDTVKAELQTLKGAA